MPWTCRLESLELNIHFSPLSFGGSTPCRASQHQVLDLCCGSGVAALHALRCGAETCVAVDLSDRACAVAKAWLCAVGGYGFMFF